mmetsp:Transcript_13821/g.44096  ORF Transcript_13821/g.44096 Transcript_13821/m.44096 type:complete len:212 (-) Transcript_13821:316-951(-)
MTLGSARKASGARPEAYMHSKDQQLSWGSTCISSPGNCTGRGGEDEAALSLTLTVSTCTSKAAVCWAPGTMPLFRRPGLPAKGGAEAQCTARDMMMQSSPPRHVCMARVIREPGRRGAVPPRFTISSSTTTGVLPSTRRTKPALAGSGPPQQNSQASREMQLRSPASRRTASNHCGWCARPSLALRRPSASTLGANGSIRKAGRIVERTAR